MSFGMVINHNLGSMNALSALSQNQNALQSALQQLSTGKKINSAADNAAGLAISQQMQSQINGLGQAQQNSQDGVSLIQTADGALNETQTILQRMNQLAVQASNDSSTNSDRQQIQKEVGQLKSEIDNIAQTTQFNGKSLLNGSLSSATNLEGTIANSAEFGSAAIAATSGTETAGTAVNLATSVSGSTGTGGSTTGAGKLASSINIGSSNNTFQFNLNGGGWQTATIASGSYTTGSDFANAVGSAIDNKLGVSGQVAVQDVGGNLQLTSLQTGQGSSVQVKDGSSNSALAAMGFSGTPTSAVGNVDLSTSFPTISSGTNDQFNVSFNGSSPFAVTIGASDTSSNIATDIQNQLNTHFGSGAITVGTNASHNLTFSTAVGSSIGLSTVTGNSGYSAFVNTSGSPITQTGTAQSSFGDTAFGGSNTVEGVSAGTVVVAGGNDQFKLSVDNGSSAGTITIGAGNYSTRQSLVDEINNQINSSATLSGKVTASVDNNTGKITFASTSTGSSSDVQVQQPGTSNESALGLLGYAGSAGSIQASLSNAVSITNGLKLSGNDTQFSVSLGQKTVSINLQSDSQISTDITNGLVSSRDTIVNAFQSQLDSSPLGSGAVTVSTNASGALVFTSNAPASKFSITDAGATPTGMKDLIDTGATTLSGTVGAVLNDVSTNGKDAQTALSGNTALTGLQNTDGNNLGLQAGNVINFSASKNGAAVDASLTVGADTTVDDLLNAIKGATGMSGATVTLDASKGTIDVHGANGAANDLENLKLSAQQSSTDTSGVDAFNNQFSNFTITQQASDAHSDKSLNMQIGANQGQTMNIGIGNMGTDALHLSDVNVSTRSGAETAISVINNALNTVSSQRAELGAYQNRLQHTINNLSTSSQNLTTAQSGITDTDMAATMAQFTKDNVLQQAAVSMLAQANQQPQLVLKLLG